MKYTIILLLIITFSSFSQETAMFDRSFHNRTDDPKSQNKREYIVEDSLSKLRIIIKMDYSELENL